MVERRREEERCGVWNTLSWLTFLLFLSFPPNTSKTFFFLNILDSHIMN